MERAKESFSLPRTVGNALILDALTEGVMSFDPEGRLTFGNKAAADLLGYSPEELLNRDGHELWAQKFLEGTFSISENPILATCRSGKSARYCTFFIRKNRTTFPVELTITPIFSGIQIVGAVVVFQDITSIREAENQLHKSDARYRRIIESLSNYIYSVRVENGVYGPTSHSDGCLAVTGFTPGEFRDNPGLWLELVHPLDRQYVIQATREILASENPSPIEHRIIHKDGSIRWIRNNRVVHREGNPGVTTIAGLIVDITERKKTAEQIIDLNAELEKRVQSRTLELQTANVELQRLAKELEEAHSLENKIGFEIQKTLLMGHPPRRIGWANVAAITIPSLGIDGDFFDFFVHGKSCFDFLFGDVMGKGVPAALVGAATKSQFQRAMLRLISRARAGGFPQPEEVVAKVHAEMTPQLERIERFVSMHFGRFDLRTSTLLLVNCGHTLPLHFRAMGGSCSPIITANAPLGLSPRETYRQILVPFQAGDVFLFFSDGVSEARSHAGEFFGVERIQELLVNSAQQKPQDILDHLMKVHKAFVEEEVPWDDLTLVAISIAKS